MSNQGLSDFFGSAESVSVAFETRTCGQMEKKSLEAACKGLEGTGVLREAEYQDQGNLSAMWLNMPWKYLACQISALFSEELKLGKQTEIG